jgi:hypothetical protein
MYYSLQESISSLESRISELPLEQQELIVPLVRKQIDGIHSWLDTALMWFDRSKVAGAPSTATTYKIQCPHCKDEIKLTVDKP